MTNNSLNVFRGENAVLDFLNPDAENFTPLVEIPKEINPFYDDGVRIHAKLLNTLPLANVKSLPAYNMLMEMSKDGMLDDVKTIIENSSGNTVLSLAVIGRLLGIKNTQAFVSYEVLREKLQMLQLFGVKPFVNDEPICPDPADKNSGIYKAKKLGEQRGFINPGQYENRANPEGHKRVTGPQIFKQLEGDIQVFCAGLGTTGTMVGTSSYLKEQNESVRTVGVIRTPNNPIPGVRTRGLLKMIAFNWREHVDYLEEIGTKESFLNSLNLMRHGIVAGPSSGFALAGLLRFLKKQQNQLQKLANKDGILNAVFICCDSPFPYMKEYFANLDESYFPKIEGAELLLDQPVTKNKIGLVEGYEIEPEDALNMLYQNGSSTLESKIRNGENVELADGFEIIDVRLRKEFDHYHLAGSKHVEFEAVKDLKFQEGKVLIVCNLGLKSNFLTNLLRDKGVEAYSLKGGIMEWSNRNLPRWKPDICFR